MRPLTVMMVADEYVLVLGRVVEVVLVSVLALDRVVGIVVVVLVLW